LGDTADDTDPYWIHPVLAEGLLVYG